MQTLALSLLLALSGRAVAAETSVAGSVEAAMTGAYAALSPAQASALSAFTAAPDPDPARLLADLRRPDSATASALAAQDDALVRLASAKKLSPQQTIELASRLDMVRQTLAAAGRLPEPSAAAFNSAQALLDSRLRDPALQTRLTTLITRTAAALAKDAPASEDGATGGQSADKASRLPPSWKLQRSPRDREADLPSDHPALIALQRNMDRLKRRPKDSHIDDAKTLAFIQTLNDGLPGAFELVPQFQGFTLAYSERGRQYFIEFRSWGPEAQTFYPIGVDPNKRFEGRPEELTSLVGFERDALGRIQALYSDSRHLTEYRDMSGFGDPGLAGLFDANPKDHEALPRTAMEVPLAAVKIAGWIKKDEGFVRDLPYDLRRLLQSGYTLTTWPSLAGIARDYQDNDRLAPNPHSPSYSALIIAADDGQGRTGVVMQDGKPIIVERGGKEYFLEIKGIGLATQAPIRERVHKRSGHSIRSGRASAEQVKREFEGHEMVLESGLDGRALAEPVLGLTLPEFANSEDVYQGDDEGRELAGQVFRLAPSTRRMAYSDNAAYGPAYSKRPLLLERAIEYYGEIFARLRLEPPDKASMHESLHPQNLVYSPWDKTFAVTDFSDIHRVDPHYYLYPDMPDIPEYQAFRTAENRAALLRGIKKGLEPRGLWTDGLRALENRRFDMGEFLRVVTAEVLVPQFLAQSDAATIHKQFVPTARTPYHLAKILQGEAHAVQARDSYLEITFRLWQRDLGRDLERIGMASAARVEGGQPALLRDQARAAEKRVRALRAKIAKFYAAEESKGEGKWKDDLAVYARIALSYVEEEAAIYDSVTAYRAPGATSNLDAARTSDLAKFVAQAPEASGRRSSVPSRRTGTPTGSSR